MYISKKILDDYILNLNQLDFNELTKLYIEKSGIEIERVLNNKIDNICIGKIVDIKPHFNADRLKICSVDIEDKILEIICGANNVEINKKVVVALPGAQLPGGIKIKKSKIRGVESFGMICSLKELGFDNKDLPKKYSEGILLIDDNLDVNLGDLALKVLNLNYQTLDASVTTNRSDLTNYYGILKETAAITKNKLNNDIFSFKKYKEDKYNIRDLINNFSLKISDKSYFNLMIFKDINYIKTPQWLELFLINHKIEIKNTIDDLFKYVELISGIPICSLDIDKIKNKDFYLKKGHTLKEGKWKNFIQNNNNLNIKNKDNLEVLCSSEEIICILGFDCNYEYKVDKNSKNIASLITYFDKKQMQNKILNTGYKTDISNKIAKGISYFLIPKTQDMIRNIITENTNCSYFLKNDITYDNVDVKKNKIYLDFELINKKIGINLQHESIISFLKDLDFIIEKDENNKVYCMSPFHRTDITLIEDVIEEITRLYGWDKIPANLPKEFIKPSMEKKSTLKQIQTFLHMNGFQEIITHLLISKEGCNYNNYISNDSIEVINPISSEYKYIKNNNIYSMLKTLQYHKKHKYDRCFLYEMGNIYLNKEKKEVLTIGMYGDYIKDNITKTKIKSDYFLLKNFIEKIISFLKISSLVEYKKINCTSIFHEDASCEIFISDEKIGFIGTIDTFFANDKEYSEDFLIADIYLDSIIDKQKRTIKYKPLINHPSIQRDLTFIVDEKLTIQDFKKIILEFLPKNCLNFLFKDIYKNEDIKNKKSITVEFTFNDEDRTLKNKEVSEIIDVFLLELEKKDIFLKQV